MKLYIETIPTTPWSAFVAPTAAGSGAALRPQGGTRPVDVHTQDDFMVVGDAGMNAGYRPWRPLIT
jgi:hypothetical protein